MEISLAYRFCPLCGSQRDMESQSRPFKCLACDHTSFFGPVGAVGAIVTNNQGQVLLIERAREPGLGKLGMPGGFVDPNESAEVALRREIGEEVGVQVGRLVFLMTAPNAYKYQGIVYPVLDLYYQTELVDGQSIAPEASEVSSWMWTELTSQVLDRIAFPSNRQALEFFMKQSTSG